MYRALPSLLILQAASAHAGNNDEFWLGDLAAISGGAVVAAGSDAGVLPYNPAGLVGLARSSLSLGASVYSVRSVRIPRYLVSETTTETSIGDFDDRIIETVPALFVAAWKVRDDLGVALSLTVPRSRQHWLDSENRITGDATLRESLRDIDDFSLYHGGVTAAWSPHPVLRIGATMGSVVSIEDRHQQLSIYYDESQTERELFATIDERRSAQLLGLDIAIGLQVRITDFLNLGASFRSPSIGVYGDSEVTTRGYIAITEPGFPTGSAEIAQDNSASALGEWIRPWEWRVGLAYRRPHGWLSLQLDRHGSTTSALGSDRDAVTNYRVGGVFILSEALQAGAGLFSDNGSDLQSSAFNFDYWGASTGLRWANRLALGKKNEPLLLYTTLALRYAYGTGTTETLRSRPADGIDALAMSEQTRGKAHEVSLYMGSGVAF